MSKVYVVQETEHDFTPAEQYGEVIFMSVSGADDFKNIRGSQSNERLLAHLAHVLRDFSAEDFIVLTGSPYVSAAVFLILGNRGIQSVRLLRWDNRDFVYRPLYIELRKETVS